jgi:CHAT domain-containing protein
MLAGVGDAQVQDLREQMDRAAACGNAGNLPGCLAALYEALPLLASPSTDPQRAADQCQAARMAVLAGDQELALRFASLLLEQVCSMQPGSAVNELVLANLYSWAFVPFVRSNSWLESQHLTGLGAFLAGIVQRIRPDLDAAGWAGWAYAEELATRARDYAASAAVDLGRCLFKGPELETHGADALALAGVALEFLDGGEAVRSSRLIASDAYCLIGRVLLASGDLGSVGEKAQSAFEASLDIQAEIGTAADLAVDQSNLGAVCMRIAEVYQARAERERARARRAAAENKPEIATPAAAAAGIAADNARQKWQRAVELLNAAKPFSRKHPGRAAATLFLNSAAANAQLGDLTTARADLVQALALADADAATLIHLQRARLEIEVGDFPAAEQALIKALPGRDGISPSGRIMLLGSYGTVLRKLGRVDEALTYLNDALDGIETVRRNSLSARVGIALLKTHRWIPEALIACCAELNRPEHAGRAFDVAEMCRWLSFAGATRYHPIQWSGPPHPLLAEERELLDRIKTTDLGSSDVAADPAVATAFARLAQIWSELDKIDPDYVAIRRSQPVAAGQVSAFLDDTVTAFVVYYLGEEIDDLAVAWVFRHDELQPRLIRLPCKADALATDVDALRAANDDKPLDGFKSAGRRLYAALIAPLASALPASGGVCFVPFGPIHNVPFAGLFDGQRYFLETRAMVVAPSLTALRWARRHNNGLGPRHSLIVAATGSTVLNKGKGIDLSLFADLARKSLLPLLPGARLVTKEQATKPFLLACLAEDAEGAPWSIVHIAGHGLFETLLPDGTLAEEGLGARLILTGPASEDRDLSALEIAVTVRPRGALVVLSACDSGVTTTLTNEELFGLAHAFLYAGSATVLASVWYVVQQHGVELTRRFYTKLLDNELNLSHVEALRQAQLETMRETTLFGLIERPVHPYIWAAFQLMGDWRRNVEVRGA